jgi:hypothetical protein
MKKEAADVMLFLKVNFYKIVRIAKKAPKNKHRANKKR